VTSHPESDSIGIGVLARFVGTVLLLSLVSFGSPSRSAAQTFKVIHTFTNGADGGYPYAGLAIDGKGNLYGTANQGGNWNATCPPMNEGCGTVFQLTPSKSGWDFQTIYAFQGGLDDGQGPYGRVTIGPDGGLYGTTIDGGNANCPSGCGMVFGLKEPTTCSTAGCPWKENILYAFQGDTDGFYPIGDVTFDPSGNIYGTTTQGGVDGPGTIYELRPSNGKWTENILYNFTGQYPDGGNPYSGVILDKAGNIYSTTLAGGINDGGIVSELTRSGSGWKENILYAFQGSNAGIFPIAGLLLTASGALVGGTEADGANDGGTVYSLTPSNGKWNFAVLNGLAGIGGGCGPWASLIMDAAGSLYGTTQGYPPAGDYGYVFKLSRAGNSWKETILHRFSGGPDGSVPYSTLVFDSAGNLYGTTNLGGSGYGVVFEITP